MSGYDDLKEYEALATAAADVSEKFGLLYEDVAEIAVDLRVANRNVTKADLERAVRQRRRVKETSRNQSSKTWYGEEADVTYAVYSTRRDRETRKPVLKDVVKIFDDKEKAKAYAVRKRKERDAEQRRLGDSYTVKKLSAEDAVDQKQKDKKKRLTKAIIDEAQQEGPEVYALTEALLEKYDLTYDQLRDFDPTKIDYETDDSEYISMGSRASVRSHNVSGSIDIQGETFSVENVPYLDSDVHGI